MPPLPLKLQIGIRDHWAREDGGLQKAVRRLREVLGHEVVVEPEWRLLLAELDGAYPDKADLAAAVAGCVAAWCGSAVELLEDEANEAWTEALLERLKAWSRLRLHVEVCSGNTPTTAWSAERASFVLRLPKKRAVAAPAEYYPVFRGALLRCFDEPVKNEAFHADNTGAAAAAAAAAAAPVDDWADVELDTTTGRPAVVEKKPTAASPAGPAPLPAAPPHKVTPTIPQFLPDVVALPRPDELLRRPPYYLIVYDGGPGRVNVHSSHSASLQLLADYLRRWCRVNHNDTRNPPAVEVRLEQSPWGLGQLYDRLVLAAGEVGGFRGSSAPPFAVTPTIVLALVEGVLGYERISVEGTQWAFRRDVEFRER